MGIIGFTSFPSATHFSISPATCQGQAAEAVAAFAGIHRRQPQAPGIICASQFARLQKILNTAEQAEEVVPPSGIVDSLAVFQENDLIRLSTVPRLKSLI